MEKEKPTSTNPQSSIIHQDSNLQLPVKLKFKEYTQLGEFFYQTHVTFTSVADITLITQPLIPIGLPYFTFDRTYLDGTHLRLTNAGKWIESYYRSDLYKAAIFEKDPRLFCSGYVLWSWLSREPIYSEASRHDIDHGLTIIEKHESYSDFFHFGTTCNHYISPDELIQRIDFLYRFVAYFKQKARPIIIEAENTRIKLIVPNKQKIELNAPNLPFNQQENLVDLYKKTDITRFYLGEKFANAYLTRREMDILWLLKDGNKPIEIATQIGISNRTLETHIKNIKLKLGCGTLFELGFVLGTLGLKNIYPFKVQLVSESDYTEEK